MTLGLTCLLGALMAWEGGFSTPRWSPDGQWLAATSRVGEAGASPAPELALLSLSPDRRPAAAPAEAIPERFQIEVINATTLESRLIHESPRVLSAPEWAPDGRSLAFASYSDAAKDGKPGWEIRLQAGTGPSRLLVELQGQANSAAHPPDAPASVVWSPDGRYLAVALPELTPRVVILRADNGRLLRTLEGVSTPSWSPDGQHLAVVRGSGEGQSLEVLDTALGSLRGLAEVGQIYQRPMWLRDGKALLLVTRRESDPTAPSRHPSIDLTRVASDSGAVQKVLNLGTDPTGHGPALRGVCFALDREGEELFWSFQLDGQPNVIVWNRVKTKETVTREHPLDFSVAVECLALSPGGRTLAIRLASPGSVLALWEPAEKRFTPVAAGAVSRRAWLRLLLDAARRLLSGSLPPVAVDGRAVDRPTLLPVPGEIAPNHEVVYRARRLALTGLPLLGMESDPGPRDPARSRFLAETRLAFAYLTGDFATAGECLQALEAGPTDRQERWGLLALRAQVRMARGEYAETDDVLRYLVELDATVPQRIESTTAGFVLTPQPVPQHGWPRYLSQRAEDLKRAGDSGELRIDGLPLGNRNPDAPATPAGLAIPLMPRVEPVPVRPRMRPRPPAAPR